MGDKPNPKDYGLYLINKLYRNEESNDNIKEDCVRRVRDLTRRTAQDTPHHGVGVNSITLIIASLIFIYSSSVR